MIEPRDLPALSREELLALVVELQRQITELRAEIDQLTRGGKGQAAPCSKGIRVADPKPPGRTPGSGSFRDREAPPPEAITEPPVDVRVTLEACPACGGPLEEARVDLAYRTEIPALPRPQVTQYRGNLRRFFADPRIEPTNNRAERALRPAVIARQVSQGSKTGRGTHAFEAFTSVVRTLTKQGIDALVEGLYHLFRSPRIQDVPP